MDTERDGTGAHASWGRNPRLDLSRGVYSIEMGYDMWDHGQELHLRDGVFLRLLMPLELSALVELSGRFCRVGWHGDLTVTQPLDDSEGSWRMIAVLQKRQC